MEIVEGTHYYIRALAEELNINFRLQLFPGVGTGFFFIFK